VAKKTNTPNPTQAETPTVAETPEAEPRTCLCGCGSVLKGKKALFVQGHDAKLKSAVLRGLPVEPAGLAYANQHWPDVVLRQGSKAPKPKADKKNAV
jgi:hypothetical protein